MPNVTTTTERIMGMEYRFCDGRNAQILVASATQRSKADTWWRNPFQSSPAIVSGTQMARTISTIANIAIRHRLSPADFVMPGIGTKISKIDRVIVAASRTE